MEQRLAEAGAGRDERDIAAAERLAFLQHVDFRVAQHRHRPRHRLEIVQQEDVAEAERRRDAAPLDAPRHVGERRALV